MWDRIEGDWSVFRHRVRHEWARLTDEHVDQIDGRRDRLARRVRDVYGISDDEAEKQVAAWETSLRANPEPVPGPDSDPGHRPPSPHAQPFYNGTKAAAETQDELLVTLQPTAADAATRRSQEDALFRAIVSAGG
jgi:uncharacterized protein YjbJ (UPF0337 family)